MKKNLLKVSALALCTAFSLSAMAELQETVIDTVKYEFKADSTAETATYTLENNWLLSSNTNNYKAGDLAILESTRGMDVKDGKMYFCTRDKGFNILVVDGATGKLERTIALPEHTFQKELYAGTDTAKWENVAVLPNNDIHFDEAGNCLVGSAVGDFQIYLVEDLDKETATAKLIINTVPKEAFPEATIRFDAFGVCGDVKTNAIIMAVNASALEAYKWVITDGVSGEPEQILLDPFYEGCALNNPGSAPRIFPIDENMFYVDGNATFPTLYDMDGTVVDCFLHEGTNADGEKVMVNYPSIANFNEGHNGLFDFEVVNKAGKTEYFICLAARNTVGAYKFGVPASTYAILKYKDENRAFEDTERLFLFPSEGFGVNSNSYRTAAVGVEVKENKAEIYLYVGENGLGKYTFTNLSEEKDDVAVDNVIENNINVIVENGNIILSEAADVEVYAITGQRVAAAKNVENIAISNNGIFIVKAVNAEGTTVQKVIVK